MPTRTTQYTSDSIKKPCGGYRLISVPQICMAWRAYKSKLLPKFYDLRVYFALHEVDERRAAENRKRRREGLRPRRFVLERRRLLTELHELLDGLNPRLISASLRRLQRIELVRVTRHQITFARWPSELRETELDGFERMLRRIDRRESIRRRPIPMPRRLLRDLASHATPGVLATMLAHAIRCLWLRHSSVRFIGTCPTGFVSEVFETNRRTVIRARHHLVSPEVAWLARLPTAPHIHQRYGPRYAINVGWQQPTRLSRCSDTPPSGEPIAAGLSSFSNPAASAGETATPPPSHPKRTGLSPPIETKNLLTEVQPPRTVRRGGPGVSDEVVRTTPPSLDRISMADLQSTERLQQLYVDAVHRRWVGRAPADRLAFFGAAERALRVATRNPPGLFAAILRRKLWSHVTQADEDAACRKLGDSNAMAEVCAATRPLDAPRADKPRADPRTRSLDPVRRLVSTVANACSMDGVTHQSSDTVPRLLLNRKVA